MRNSLSGNVSRVFLALAVLSAAIILSVNDSDVAASVEKSASKVSKAVRSADPIVGRAVGFGISPAVTKLPEVVGPEAGAARLTGRKYGKHDPKQTQAEKNPLNANRVKKRVFENKKESGELL